MLSDGGVCLAWTYSKASGLFGPFELVDGEAGLLECTANGELWESWYLPTDQPSNIKFLYRQTSIERLTKLLLASGQLELLGLGDGDAGFLNVP